MSLRNRLRFSIISLVTVMVAIQFLATLRVTADADFHDALARSKSTATQVRSLLTDRLTLELRRAENPPRTIDESIAFWTDILENDPTIGVLLEQLMASSMVAVEIQVCDQVGKILSSSSPTGARMTYRSLPDFEEWNIGTLWNRLWEVLTTSEEFSTTIPLGVSSANGTRPIFTIRVITSSVLLRDMVVPQLNNLGVTSALSLLAAMLLAVLFSNMVLRALNRLAQRIDYLTAGDFASAAAPHGRESEEIAVVSSKLNLLSAQFRDAMQLRGNIDQLLSSIETAVLMFDPDQRLVLAGQSAERLIGKPRHEIIGHRIDEIFPVDTALGEAITNAVNRGMAFRDRPAIVERENRRALRLLVSVELLENLPGLHQLGTLITLRDVESRRKLQSQIDISARLTAINRLTGGVAHEIKNPLNAIALHLEVLKAKLSEPNDVGTEMEIIEREIARLDRVVKTFLDFTRPVELKMEAVDLVNLIADVATLVAPEATKSDVEVFLNAGVDKAIIQGDTDLLKQAILNVVMNAIEAMKQGGSLSVDVSRCAEYYDLRVADEGPGIPPEIEDKIFNLYFTTKAGGSGIGLAMTFRVVNLHNATIEFSSEIGKGTTFRFRFAALEEGTDGKNRQSTEAEEPATDTGELSRRIG